MVKKIWEILLLLIILAGLWYAGNTLFSRSFRITQMNTPIQVKNKYFGVNIAGPEFQQAMYADKKYTSYSYFNKKGLTLMRIPFKWERLQPTLHGNLDSNQLSLYTTMIATAQNTGEKVIIEAHNYGRYNNTPLTTNDLQNFSDLWGKLAQKFNKGYAGIWGYELMNEPHD